MQGGPTLTPLRNADPYVTMRIHVAPLSTLYAKCCTTVLPSKLFKAQSPHHRHPSGVSARHLSSSSPPSFPGATTDAAAGTDAQTVRKSTSRKQLHFAPLQLGRTSEQPHATPDCLGMVEELMSPSRSKSLGAAVERALLMDALDAEAAVAKDRPHSATQFSRKVGMRASGCSNNTLDHDRGMLCAVKYPVFIHCSRQVVEASSVCVFAPCVRVCIHACVCVCMPCRLTGLNANLAHAEACIHYKYVTATSTPKTAQQFPEAHLHRLST